MIKKHKKEPYPMNKPEQSPDILRIKLFYIPPNKTIQETLC